jgi:hypothetical protein
MYLCIELKNLLTIKFYVMFKTTKIRNSQFAIRNSQFAIRNSQFAIRKSPSTLFYAR